MFRSTSDLPTLVSDRGHVSDSITTKDGLNEDDSDDDFEGFEDEESEEVEGNGAQANALDRSAQVKEWIRQSKDESNKGRKWKDKAFNIAAPLPLLSFKTEASEVTKAITITGDTCTSVLNKIPDLSFVHANDGINHSDHVNIPPSSSSENTRENTSMSSKSNAASEEDKEDSWEDRRPIHDRISNRIERLSNSGEKLQDPRMATRLNRFFTVRSERELLVRQSDFMKDQQQSLASKLESNSSQEKDGDNDDDTVVSEPPLGSVNRKKTLAESLGAIGEMPRLVDFLVFDERNENNDDNNEMREKHLQASYDASTHIETRRDDNTPSDSVASHTNTTRSQSKGTERVMSPIKTERDDALSSTSTLVVPCQCFDASSLQAQCSQSNNGKDGKDGKDGNATNGGSTECLYCKQRKSCTFDSSFECGNLQKVVRTEGREKLMPRKVIDNLNSSLPGNATPGLDTLGVSVQPSTADHEYNLWCRKDLNTGGNIQWYYFSITAPPDLQHVGSKHGVSYPLTVRLNIVNMMKNDALYNYGMRPAVLSLHDKRKHGADWEHRGYDICYYKNSLTSVNVDNLGSSLPQVENNSLGISSSFKQEGKGKKKVKQFYTLTFTYTFTEPDTVYFAHCYPYTYSDLQHYLRDLERDERICQIMTRRVLCYTIAGNRCDLLTITGRSQDKDEVSKRPAIVFSARIHPGETNSSYAMHGCLQFLLDDTPEAIALRQTFVFKIVPMLNPDGVIHGNYRCSLAATDLNRRFGNCNMYLHPTVYNLNRMLCHLQDSRGVLLYLDIHGHSKNKNVFFYGCDIVQQPEHWLRQDLANKTRMEILAQRVYCRIFPMIVCSLSSSNSSNSHNSNSSNSTNSSNSSNGSNGNTSGGKHEERGDGGSGNGSTSSARSSQGYFCYDDNKFAVSKSKKGTGRVVAWKEIGIEGAYTIELSFCGIGNNKEGSILKKAEQRRYEAFLSKNRNKLKKYIKEANRERADKVGKLYSKANSSSSVSAAHNGGSVSSVSQNGEVAAMFSNCDFSFEDILVYENLVASYKTAKHFSKKDMLFIGHDIGLALVHFTNLPMAYKFKARRTQDASRFESYRSTTSHSNNSNRKSGSTSSRQTKIRGIIGGNATTASLEEEFNLRISDMASPRRQEEESLLMASVDAAEGVGGDGRDGRDGRDGHHGSAMKGSESEDSLVSLDNDGDDSTSNGGNNIGNDNASNGNGMASKDDRQRDPNLESGESGEESIDLTARSTARSGLCIDESDGGDALMSEMEDDNSDIVMNTGRDSILHTERDGMAGRDSMPSLVVGEADVKGTGNSRGQEGAEGGEESSIATNYSAFDAVPTKGASHGHDITSSGDNDGSESTVGPLHDPGRTHPPLPLERETRERNEESSGHISKDLLKRLNTPVQYPELDDLFYKSSCLKKPLVEAATFCSDAITFAQKRYPKDFFTKIGSDNNENVGMRVKVELAVTRQLGYILINPSSIDRGMIGGSRDVDDGSQDSRNSSVAPSPSTIETCNKNNSTDKAGSASSPLAPSDMNGDDNHDNHVTNSNSNKHRDEREARVGSPANSVDNVRSSSPHDARGSTEGTPKDSPRITNEKRLSRKEKLRRKRSGGNKGNTKDGNSGSNGNNNKKSFPKLDFDMEEFTQAGQRALEEEGESDGSDSEPSVDNVPTEDMLKTLSKVKKGSGSEKKTDRAGASKRMSVEHIANTLRAAEIKLRQKELLASKQQAIAEKQRMAQLQKLALKKMHEEKLMRDSRTSSTGPPTALYLQKGTSSSSARVKAQLFTVQVPSHKRKKAHKHSPYVPSYKLSSSPASEPSYGGNMPSPYSNVQEALFNQLSGNNGNGTSSGNSNGNTDILSTSSSTSMSLTNANNRTMMTTSNRYHTGAQGGHGNTQLFRPVSAHLHMSNDPTFALVDQMNQMNSLNSQYQRQQPASRQSTAGGTRSNRGATKPSGAGSIDVDETILLLGLPDEMKARVASRVSKASALQRGSRESGKKKNAEKWGSGEKEHASTGASVWGMGGMGIASTGGSTTGTDPGGCKKEGKISFVGDGSSPDRRASAATSSNGGNGGNGGKGGKDIVLPVSKEKHSFEIRSPVQTSRKRSDSHGHGNSLYKDVKESRERGTHASSKAPSNSTSAGNNGNNGNNGNSGGHGNNGNSGGHGNNGNNGDNGDNGNNGNNGGHGGSSAAPPPNARRLINRQGIRDGLDYSAHPHTGASAWDGEYDTFAGEGGSLYVNNKGGTSNSKSGLSGKKEGGGGGDGSAGKAGRPRGFLSPTSRGGGSISGSTASVSAAKTSGGTTSSSSTSHGGSNSKIKTSTSLKSKRKSKSKAVV